MRWAVNVAVVCAAGVVIALASPPAVGQPASDGGRRDVAGRPLPPHGILGDHLGPYLTVEGVRAEGTFVGRQTLLVDIVNGRRLEKPVHIWVNNLLLPGEKRCVMKGYESGEMIGKPPAVEAAAKEQGKPVGHVQAGWQWKPHFVALIVVEPKGLELPKE